MADDPAAHRGPQIEPNVGDQPLNGVNENDVNRDIAAVPAGNDVDINNVAGDDANVEAQGE